MIKIILGTLALSFVIALYGGFMAEAQNSGQQVIYKQANQAPVMGSPEYFTGQVKITNLFPPNESRQVIGAYVTFEPNARTHWHIHPTGQHLVALSGVGRTGTADGQVEAIKPGDVVWCPPGIKHWHGASPNSAMTHLALTGSVDGLNVQWLEMVSDEQYHQGQPTPKDPKVSDNRLGSLNSDEIPLRYQKIALIAAFVANGDLENLKLALNEGLNTSLTVNEIKEVLIHTCAYAGFPRALNGLNAFIEVMKEREIQGIKDVYGPESKVDKTDKSKYERGYDTLAKLRDPAYKPGPKGSIKINSQRRANYEIFAPTIEVFLKEHIFADLFSRVLLDYKSREIATIGVISNLPGANSQLQAHIGLAMKQGFSASEMKSLFQILRTYLGQERGDNALSVLSLELDEQK
ncbi:MAG: carboxymuconolactone decarboxylase family protein [Deltaproteobacteria bacterium]|jgi:quercetin dioxygenase-like cupin family protein/alkylhydroperoxidase/carboxymuconolactone decarboxylase family protein YurZ|nr:carboxymuconolactone decarboxylase family protein [Deltaproteobacteria bacterium]